MQRRKATYKLYPSQAQLEILSGLLRSHKDLWNAALEERIDAWRKAKRSISYEDQCRSLTQIRSDWPEEWGSINCSSQQITLRRLGKAFRAFFNRCAAGKTAGFPRFKSLSRMPGIGFKGDGDGWRFSPNLANAGRPDDFGVVRWTKHGTLRLKGVGHIKVRGNVRAAGVIKSCDLLHRHGEWSVSITMECADVDVRRPRTAHHAMSADWGVSRLLTVIRTDGAHGETREDHDNQRWYQSNQNRLLELDRAVSTKRRGSRNWRKACEVRGALKSKIKRQRHDHQHKLSADLAARCSVFVTEKLSIKNMTGSAAGTLQQPGINVQQKSGLNREILDTAPAALLQKITYKVQETGGMYIEAPTRKLKPSQTCPECGVVAKKQLSQRWHCCGSCGHEEDRDAAAARVVLRWALGTLKGGQELAEAV